MKHFLQIKNTTDEKPKTLEMGVDFNHIRQVQDYPAFLCNDSKKHNGFDKVCNLSDCFQSRPLIEIDGFCEFNIYIVNNNVNSVVLCTWSDYFLAFTFSGFRYDDRCLYTNLGSIFKPENKAKYPELYQQAIKWIDEYFNKIKNMTTQEETVPEEETPSPKDDEVKIHPFVKLAVSLPKEDDYEYDNILNDLKKNTENQKKAIY
jgi:hypothetical protein